MIAAYSIIWYHCPDLYESNTDVMMMLSSSNEYNDNDDTVIVPRWIFLFNCVAMLIYQTLDNMDGKQARKTGTGSALGLLFDHGCDAVNSIFGSGNWIVAMALVPGNVADVSNVDYGITKNDNMQEASLLSEWFGGDEVLACLLVLCPMMAFYISTWEQYYTGKLTLPPFNGPSEGLVLGASLSFISFLWGPMYWQTTSVIDGILSSDVFTSLIGEDGINSSFSFLIGRVRNMDLIVLASVFGLVQEVSLKMLSVSRKYGIQALWTTVPNFVMIVSTLVMVCSDSTLMLRRSRTVMHLIAGLFTEQTTQLMLDHVVEEPYEVLKRYSLFPQILLALVMVFNNQEGMLFLSSEILDRILFVYTAGLWVYLVFKIRIQIFEICDVLGIYCFDITSVHPNKMGVGVEEEGDKKTN